MQHFHKTVFLPYAKEDLMKIVLDIESYPEFVPWIHKAFVTEIDSNHLQADLSIKFGIFTDTYRSLVTFEHNKTEAFVIAESNNGPFKNLHSKWSFSDYNVIEDESIKTLVNFELDFELKSKIIEKLLSQVIIEAQNKMIDAFINKARLEYGL